MSTFSIVSVVLFVLSGVLFVTAVAVFIMTDTATSIKQLRHKDDSGNTTANLSSYVSSEKRHVIEPQISAPYSPSNGNGIEYAQQTIDTDELEPQSHGEFETQDWDLPDGVSFVLTKNIVVFHSDKEYLVHED